VIADRLPGPRITIAAALIAIALGATYYLTVQPSPTVSIRWREQVTDAQRAALERRFLLVKPAADEPRTFRYDLLDVSRSNLEAIVGEPAIEDIGNIDRHSLAFPADYPYGTSWMWLAHRIPVLRMRGVVPALAGVCVVVVVLGIAGMLKGRRPSAG
jgi:hypothetical protein